MIIGLSGKKQSGKNTVSKIICALDFIDRTNSWSQLRYGYVEIEDTAKTVLKWITDWERIDYDNKWQEVSFAFALRKCASVLTGNLEIFNLDEKSKNEPSGIKDADGNNITNRQLLQKLGTEVGRAISPNIWVDCLLKCYKPEKYWIITDVRFENEANAIKEKDGVLIRINRDTGYQDNHASETALDNYEHFDAVIDNNGSLKDLIDNVIEVVKQLKLITIW